ncbi:hypothetical protein D4764_12G0001360 [Takifugu flavidus]|uniref:Uncharacterized protein n=1 Tax=Takifugu flavidus TaxID=433684 RepID=A0A5C6PC26_9TELE|nr:hypothetical protein D4764_12G0001360 [Takifugu flavidus]
MANAPGRSEAASVVPWRVRGEARGERETLKGTPEALFQPFLLHPEMPETHMFSKTTKGGR